MATKIGAVIFDCFGVLATDSFFDFCHRRFGSDSAEMDQASALYKRASAGLVSWIDMVEQLAEMAGVDMATATKETSGMALNQQLFDFIEKELKPSYKVGLLSNVGFDWPKQNFTLEQYELFDTRILSYEVGYAKPESMIYELAAARLGMLPEECLFIDDQESFCQAARESGMEAIWFRDTQQAIQDIKRHLDA